MEHTLLEAIYEFLPIIMDNWRETETLQAGGGGDCLRVQPQAALEAVSAAEPDNVLPLAVAVELRCWCLSHAVRLPVNRHHKICGEV